MKNLKARKETHLTPSKNSAVVPQLYQGEVVRDDSAEMIKVFLEKPNQFIAEAITGGIISGTSGLLASSGRILQGITKGQFKQQLSKEFTELTQKGKIKKDFGEKLYGFQTLTEIFEMIDSGELKEKEKFEALKKLFFVLSSASTSQKEAVAYRLFKISQKLNSSQLALLRACYSMAADRQVKHAMGYTDWREMVLEKLGHRIADFVDEDEASLIDLKLITHREHEDKSGVNDKHGRLTASGMMLCKILEQDL